MPFPVGVTVRPVSFGPAVILEDGTALDMKVTIRASRSLVWNGAPMVAGGTTTLTSDQLEHTISLPVTDEDGYTDGGGNAISVADGAQTHYYTATIVYQYPSTGPSAGKQIGGAVNIPEFFLPTDDGSTVDLDDLLQVTSATGQSQLILTNWRAQLQALVDSVPTPGAAQWLKDVGGGAFGFVFTAITTVDGGTGLPTAAAILWPDGTAGAFTGTTDGVNGYTGYTATYAGATTSTLTASGITYDATTGLPLGPTTLEVS